MQFGRSESLDTHTLCAPPSCGRTQFVNGNSLKSTFLFIFFPEADEGAAAAAADATTTEVSTEAANDIQSSGSATPSPNPDNDRHIDRMPRIKSIEKINAIDSLRQLQEIDVERNIPAAYIQDTNNVNADR